MNRSTVDLMRAAIGPIGAYVDPMRAAHLADRGRIGATDAPIEVTSIAASMIDALIEPIGAHIKSIDAPIDSNRGSLSAADTPIAPRCARVDMTDIPIAPMYVRLCSIGHLKPQTCAPLWRTC